MGKIIGNVQMGIQPKKVVKNEEVKEEVNLAEINSQIEKKTTKKK